MAVESITTVGSAKKSKRSYEISHHPELCLGFRILELPVHLILDILSKLPVKSIFQCRCVCKAFYSFVKDPYFAKLCLSRAPTLFLVQQTHTGVVWLYGVDFHDTSATSNASSSHNPNHYPVDLNQRVKTVCKLQSKMDLVNSCDGFLCLYNNMSSNPRYYVCNPILNEFLSLPCSPFGHAYLNYSAFGFSPKTNEYKVVRFVLRSSEDSEVVMAEVNTVGRQSWRVIDSGKSLKPRGSLDPYVNGALHWITDSYRSNEMIYSFDLDEEKFIPIQPPSHFDVDFVKKISWINVGALQGSLCLNYVFDGATFEAWVMNDHGVKESWTKKFSIDIKFYCGLHLGTKHRPMGFMNNGDMLVNRHSKSIISYCPRKGTFKDICRFGSKIEAIPHIPSFVSLKDTLKGEEIKLMDFVTESIVIS